jgi:transposase
MRASWPPQVRLLRELRREPAAVQPPGVWDLGPLLSPDCAPREAFGAVGVMPGGTRRNRTDHDTSDRNNRLAQLLPDDSVKPTSSSPIPTPHPAADGDLVGPTKSFDRNSPFDDELRRIPTVEVMMRAPEVFVRPLSHQEAVRLKRMSTRAEHRSTPIRAAILLGSNVKTPVPQIARMWLTDESRVRQVIHEFNEEGFDSLRPKYRGGRPRRITPTGRKRVVGVAGARPDTQGVPLTRWSLDRLSAHLAELGVVISPIHLWRLLAQPGCRSSAPARRRPALTPTTRPGPPGCWSSMRPRRSTGR